MIRLVLMFTAIFTLAAPASADASRILRDDPRVERSLRVQYVQARISASQAKQAALRAVGGGEVVDISRRGNVYVVRVIRRGGRVVDVRVDARSGRVL